ncbi:MAG: S46 family peptidase [Mediterranea sp.]|nr:S46 family peptidase [Mediterranea sp.]
MTQRSISLLLVLLFSLSNVLADEGMWMPGRLKKDKRTNRMMRELGLRMPVKKIYDPEHPSLSDAIVSFGGFCSGVVVSDDGLVFTNHHCGFSSIQQHSSVEHDYLTDGFVARTLDEELPNPELYVRFLLSQEDVTHRVLAVVPPTATEERRSALVDSMTTVIGREVSERDSTLTGVVNAYYSGNEFWLSTYRDYTDVRLVFAPPTSVGKFGWDTDNWMWPRHTGDFSVFRIYAGPGNRPADYSPNNRPYRPGYVAPISLDGYREGSFCMTLGYPGTTERYLSSWGIEEMKDNLNQAMIDVRGVKQAIWKREMERRPDIQIKYAAKYDESSNYWKNSIGANRSIEHLQVLPKKRAAEASLRAWIDARPKERAEYLHLFTDLELGYGNRRAATHALAYFSESFFNGPELIQLTLQVLNFDFDADPKQKEASLKRIRDQYDNLDLDLDKELFVAMLKTYRDKVDSKYLPLTYHYIDTVCGGNMQAYADSLYATSHFANRKDVASILSRDTTLSIVNDLSLSLCMDLISTFFELRQSSPEVERGERLLNAAMRRMYADRNFYPDANSTMRLSFGTIRGYAPTDGVKYDYYTTTKGIFEKIREHPTDRDFHVQPELLSLLSTANFGRYANPRGGMNVCFISNNDITGGNSGSAMFNARGELIGLAFDGNWEAMSSDILYEPNLQRCIGVDIRYILFMIERYGQAERIIRELRI